MASIINDKTTNGRWRVRWTDEEGFVHVDYFDTLEEAQAKANIELAWKQKQIENGARK
jgi:hypothetical protein